MSNNLYAKAVVSNYKYRVCSLLLIKEIEDWCIENIEGDWGSFYTISSKVKYFCILLEEDNFLFCLRWADKITPC